MPVGGRTACPAGRSARPLGSRRLGPYAAARL